SRQHGVTISEYLRNLRLQKGLKMLRETELPIREIALACGFSSADYFGKVITAATGKIPSMHRIR
ncbi:MAG: helix-turn-helix domain-containing protein, partial [Lentisphaerae bacterium]|nr:helix-turn-helix domain-containing protein [Lentisphaerota bacterium]